MKALSKYELTTLFVNFNTSGKTAAKFRKTLVNLGFMKFDVSTYFRPTSPAKVAEIMDAIAEATVTPMTVRVLGITDKQWTDAKIIIGKDK